ncbi:PAS/PAC sensor protein [Natrialba hulunbeirensis JCM 10989]|uniref:PAS/PAC sensor protein n=1 Tax=Natrialba hulunbeirensis JCM 10989 TaxID=1227493 RepID=L9ZZW2_9EURY|nr:bacterio-opsin activator domain-containing protein [Natrialba hulunbeirensis]ELY91894.1 PAS/PAC sensor protein [Natrialba hulunbeirensis JCM 10989]
MSTRNELAAATLETLPVTVAVLGGDGEILLTNEEWQTFGPDEQPSDHVGVDYLAAASTTDDEHAVRAVDGLESLLAGEQQTFVMEYPCHSPEEKRWFSMWARQFTVDGERHVVVVHLDITDRKLAEIDAEESAARVRAERQALADVLERVDGLIRDVTDAAVTAGTRTEIERRVCRRLAEESPYELAWIGRVDVTSRTITPSEWASRDEVPLENDQLTLGQDESHPAVEALETGDSRIISDLDSVEVAEQWWPIAAGEYVDAVAAVPIAYGEVTYGVLVVFAAEADAFADRDVLVLESLAGTIATAINALETRRMLTTEAVVELELAIEDSSLFATALAGDLAATVTFRGVAYDGDGTPLAFVHVDRPEDVAVTAADSDGITDATVLSTTDDGTLLELTLDSNGGFVSTLAEHGAVIRHLETGSGVADMALELPNAQSGRSMYDYLVDHFEQVELISYQEVERPAQTAQDLMSTLESSLTERQRMALRKAYYAEYFEWPRSISGEELAESMDISRSTYHQHLRLAQQKLLDELFEGEPEPGPH